jgi:signal peptidase II
MFKLSWIAVCVFILDQASKLAAVRHLTHQTIEVMPFFNLALAYNSGAAFGFLHNAGGWQNMFFVVVAIVVSVMILSMIWRLGANDVQVAVALMLVLGGAAGNVTDRLRLSYVIDFIDVYYGSWHWPTFNIADSAITLGAILLVLDALGYGFSKRTRT